jgi:serine O-acetyltransferase
VILGPIEVGDNAKIGSGAVVVKAVPAYATVVGVPGKVVKLNGVKCRRMPDLHHELLPDLVADSLQAMQHRIDELSAQVEVLTQEVDIARNESSGRSDMEQEIEADQETVPLVETTLA